MSPGATEPLLDTDFLRVLQLLEVMARKQFRSLERGERRSVQRGQSAEFADYRPYTAGDDLRHLDWHIYHRFGELITRLYSEERNLEVLVLLDVSASMDLEGTQKREYALKLAAALAYIGMCTLDRAVIQPFAGNLSDDRFAGGGRGQVWDLFRFLEGLRFAGVTDLALSATQVAPRLSRRGIVLLVSDFYDLAGQRPALRILRGRGNDVGIIHLTTPQEEAPVLRGELQLEDRETGDLREVTVTERLRRRYAEAFAANREQVMGLARRYEVGATVARTDMDFQALMTDVILRGGILA